jgi:hypothetical protein
MSREDWFATVAAATGETDIKKETRDCSGRAVRTGAALRPIENSTSGLFIFVDKMNLAILLFQESTEGHLRGCPRRFKSGRILRRTILRQGGFS